MGLADRMRINLLQFWSWSGHSSRAEGESTDGRSPQIKTVQGRNKLASIWQDTTVSVHRLTPKTTPNTAPYVSTKRLNWTD
jgi:hypothetical protein